jgi:hypothetical protein
MKLCKDCKWFKESNIEAHECHRPELSHIDPVMGITKPSFCEIARYQAGTGSVHCGIEALLWEPKP